MSIRDRYQLTISEIVDRILTGKQIISKEYISQMLLEQIELGTSEIFEGCLSEQIQRVRAEIASATNEVKQAKIGHQLKAMLWIQTALAGWQDERQAVAVVTQTIERIIAANPDERLKILLQALDPNQERRLSHPQIQLVIKSLRSTTNIQLEPSDFQQLAQLASGLERGLNALPALEPHYLVYVVHRVKIEYYVAVPLYCC